MVKKLKVGDYILFNGMNPRHKIYAYICRINDDNTVDYIRDSLTRWTADKILVERGKKITQKEYIDSAKKVAKASGSIPTTKNIILALQKYQENFDIDISEIIEIFEK